MGIGERSDLIGRNQHHLDIEAPVYTYTAQQDVTDEVLKSLMITLICDLVCLYVRLRLPNCSNTPPTPILTTKSQPSL